MVWKEVPTEERFSSIIQQQIPNTPIYNLSLLGCTADCIEQVLESTLELGSINHRGSDFRQDIDKTLGERVKLVAARYGSSFLYCQSFPAKSKTGRALSLICKVSHWQVI